MGISYTIGGSLALKLQKLINPDFTILMARWRSIMQEDNRKGVMAGTDGDDQPLEPVKYRTGIPAPFVRRNRYGKGIKNPVAPGSSGENLTTAQYKTYTGPPLAPRGVDSRVIRNYQTRQGHEGDQWFAEGAWVDVFNKDGKPFLQYHFDGSGRLPKRDLRGVRAWGRAEALKELRLEVNRILRGQR